MYTSHSCNTAQHGTPPETRWGGSRVADRAAGRRGGSCPRTRCRRRGVHALPGPVAPGRRPATAASRGTLSPLPPRRWCPAAYRGSAAACVQGRHSSSAQAPGRLRRPSFRSRRAPTQSSAPRSFRTARTAPIAAPPTGPGESPRTGDQTGRLERTSAGPVTGLQGPPARLRHPGLRSPQCDGWCPSDLAGPDGADDHALSPIPRLAVLSRRGV
jgi:hypothetical protein